MKKTIIAIAGCMAAIPVFAEKERLNFDPLEAKCRQLSECYNERKQLQDQLAELNLKLDGKVRTWRDFCFNTIKDQNETEEVLQYLLDNTYQDIDYKDGDNYNLRELIERAKSGQAVDIPTEDQLDGSKAIDSKDQKGKSDNSKDKDKSASQKSNNKASDNKASDKNKSEKKNSDKSDSGQKDLAKPNNSAPTNTGQTNTTQPKVEEPDNTKTPTEPAVSKTEPEPAQLTDDERIRNRRRNRNNK